MTQQIQPNYLRLLRKQHGLTLEALAQLLSVSRQDAAEWESGTKAPDSRALARMSALYQIPAQRLLEPKAGAPRIADFEQITELARRELGLVLSAFSTEEIVKASMGASPRVNALLAALLPAVDFQLERERTGPVRLCEVEEIQNKIVALINLLQA